jgi:Kef-type K+ transport system membrane component KefB
MNVLSHQSSRIILAAAVIDDILALLILAAVSGMASSEGINWLHIGSTAVLAVAFVGFMAFIGTRIVDIAAPQIERLKVRDPLFVVAIALCLGLALLSYKIGMAAIIGAFLAGMVLADRSDQSHLLDKAESLVNMMLPFFLVHIGMQVDLAAFTSVPVIVTAIVITLLAVAGKYFGGLWAASSQGKRSAAQIGMGMVPRGEVGIVAAQIGLSLGALTQTTFAIVLFMAVSTTLIAPPFLRRLFAGETVTDEQLASRPVVEERPFRVE